MTNHMDNIADVEALVRVEISRIETEALTATAAAMVEKIGLLARLRGSGSQTTGLRCRSTVP